MKTSHNESPLTRRERFVRASAGFIVNHAWWTAATTLALAGFLAFHLPNLRTNNNIDNFLLDGDADTEYWKSFVKAFPKDEFILIALETDDVFTPKSLAALAQATTTLEERLDADVTSLTNVNDMVGEDDSFIVDRFLPEIPQDPAALAELKRRALANPLFQKTLLSADGKTAAIVIYPNVMLDTSENHEALMKVIDESLEPLEREGWKFYRAGIPITSTYLYRYMDQDMRRFIPLAFILVLIVVWAIFRNLRLLLLAGLGIGATLAATLGFGAFIDVGLNNGSVAAIPVILALALSDAIHVFSHLDRQYWQGGRQASLRRVLETIFFPCLLTSVNTGIGFASLIFNRVPAIREFGVLATAGMVIEFFITFGLVVPMLLLFRPETIYQETQKHESRGIPRFLRWLSDLVKRRAVMALVACLAVVGWSAWEARKLRVETDLIEFFRKDSPVRRDTDFMRAHLTGIAPLDIAFETKERYGLREPVNLRVIEDIQTFAESVPGIDAATSLVEYFKEMNQSMNNENPAYYRLPATRAMADQFLLLYSDDDLDDYVNSTYDRGRISLRLSTENTARAAAVVNLLQKKINQTPLPAGLSVRIVGITLNEVRTVDAMVQDQVKNVITSVFTIWLVMVVVLGSVGWALLFLVPNLFPIIINFGIMGAFGIPLNTGTALIAASAFGIIVDDTVHFFDRLREVMRHKVPFAQALREVTFEKGEAALSSAVILSIGFGVLMLGHFRPVFHFGLLNIVVLFTGMVGDLVLLKSILIIWARRKEKRAAAG